MTQIALITGGATGIGAEVARQMAASGASVAICDVNVQAGEAVAKQLGGKFFHCDVANREGMEQTLQAVVQALGVPNYAHLNAGIMSVPTNAPTLAIEDLSEDQYRKIVGVNLDGVYHGLRTLLPAMREQGGAITMTASTAGLSLVPTDPMYTATKYAVIGLARSVAAANADTNVRINAICPGVVDTQIVPDVYKRAEFGMMSTAELAAEVVDLLQHGANGEIRVKYRVNEPAYAIEIPNLQR